MTSNFRDFFYSLRERHLGRSLSFYFFLVTWMWMGIHFSICI